MSWYTSSEGKALTGSEQDSFVNMTKHIPDNTVAPAILKSFEIKEYQGERKMHITWGIIDGDFKGYEARQSIKVFDINPHTCDIAKNMFVRIAKLCEWKPSHDREPNNEDLALMRGKICTIKIGNGIMEDGKERTWVREVHGAGTLPTETGHTAPVVTSAPHGSHIESAFSRNQANLSQPLAEDIPF